MGRRARRYATWAVLLAAGLLGVRVAADHRAPDPAELWVEPSDLTRRDLFDGPGGPSLRPVPHATYKFLEKDDTGYSPGFSVEDASGQKWDVKYGPEAKPEVVVSRLAWAIGYHQPPTYYVEYWSLAGGGLPGPQTPGRFRPELPHKKQGHWSWTKNPFVGTRPLGGLLALMHLVNNWDLTENNNVIYELDEPAQGARRWYCVKDLGAAFGNTASIPYPHQGTKNDLPGFERQDFVKGVQHGRVRFDDVNWVHRKLLRDLTPEDVRFACERLDRLTPRQWHDAFRAAAYPPDEAERFIASLRQKVRQGLSLSEP